MNKFIASTSCLFIALTLSGCVTLSGPGWLPSSFNEERTYIDQINTEISEPSASHLQAMTKDMQAYQSSGFGLVADDKLEGYLNSRLETLKESAGFKNIPAKIYIVAESSLNTYTTAPGNIYIPLMQLQQIKSVDEFDALIAHELSHIVLDHTSSDFWVNTQKKLTSVYNIINKLGINKNDSAASQLAKKRMRNSLMVYAITDKFLNPAWTRTQEYQADKMAADILVKNGDDVYAIVALLDKIDKWEEHNKKLQNKRLEEINRLAVATSIKFVPAQWQALTSLALNPIADKVEESVNELSQSHAGTADRLLEIDDYIDQHYMDAPRPKQKITAWRQQTKNARINALYKSYQQVSKAEENRLIGKTNLTKKYLNYARVNGAIKQNFYAVSLMDLNYESSHYKQVINNNFSKLKYPSYRLKLLSSQAENELNNGFTVEQFNLIYDDFKKYGEPISTYYDLLQLAAATDNDFVKAKVRIGCNIAFFLESRDCSFDEDGGNTDEIDLIDVASQSIMFN